LYHNNRGKSIENEKYYICSGNTRENKVTYDSSDYQPRRKIDKRTTLPKEAKEVRISLEIRGNFGV